MKRIFLTLVLFAAMLIGAAHQICEFGDITLNNITESSYIDIKLFRKDAAGLPATVWLLGFDIHIPVISLGSPNEYPSR